LRRNPADTDKRQECLEIMEKECQRLNNLLTSFLDFARPRPPKLLAVDIPDVLDSVVGLVSHTLVRRSVSLRKETAIQLPALECDPEFLRRDNSTPELLPFDLSPQGISLDAVEKDLILKALIKFDWNQTQAARYLDISRRTLIYRMEKHGVRKELADNGAS
jgi:hypothetical protein